MVTLLVVIAGVILILSYVLYGGILSGVFKVGDNPTPSQKFYDGKDYVPAKNWFVLFGHHFASIAGADWR